MVSASLTHELYSDILSYIGDAVFLVGNGDRVVYANKQLVELTGITREEIIGKPYNFLLSQIAARTDNARQTLEELLATLDRINHVPTIDLAINKPSLRYLQFALIPLSNPDDQAGWGGVLHDISAEHQRIRSRIEVLLALTDEMRSSLVSIVGWANTVLSGYEHWSSDELYDFLKAINSNAEGSIHLLENVRDVSRLQLNELVLDCRPTDLKRLFQSVGRKLAEEVTGLNLVQDISDNLPMVELDAIRMSRGFQNLLYCVLKLSFGCKVQLAVRQEEGRARVDISYKGISLSERLHRNEQEKILQDHSHGSQIIRELELRLFVARGILSLHDAHIWTEDLTDQGTVVHIALPLKQRSSNVHDSKFGGVAGAETAGTRSSKPNAKILVAEDDERILRLLRVQLELKGYRVITAHEGWTALELAAVEMPDVILLSLYLPDTDGLGICQQLREFTSAPIIILASDSDEKIVIRSLNMGADDYVTKPLRTKELFARIQANLRRSCLSEISDKSNGKALFKVRDLEIDFVQRHVLARGHSIDLTPIEYKLLHYLAMNAGRILTHGQLISKVWGPMFTEETQYLWVNIRRLRSKIEDDPGNPEYILTERGVGYYLTGPDGDFRGL